MLDVLTGFVAELRQAGLPVSVAEEADAAEALGHLPLEDRQAIKFALGATLVKSANHWRAFDTAFEIYFSMRGPQFSVSQDAASPASRRWAATHARRRPNLFGRRRPGACHGRGDRGDAVQSATGR